MDEALIRRGRDAFERKAWTETHEALFAADETAPLSGADLELLATAAYLLGREEEWMATLERAHTAHLSGGDVLRAARCAFWVRPNSAQRGQIARATGWLARAQRILEDEKHETAEHGYLLIPRMFQLAAEGDLVAAAATAGEAADIGQRRGDPDLFALAAHSQGELLIRHGNVGQGLRLLDEAMVVVTSQDVSPIVAGIVYCGVIAGCQLVYELGRAQEWTEALTEWCAEQPDLEAFTGRCLVHRAEIMQLRGAWPAALEEARRAGSRTGGTFAAAAEGLYRQGEIHRLRGNFRDAERAYREASKSGWEPQPGFALARLAQGDAAAAAAAIRRAVGETSEPLARARLLPAYVEIMLAIGAHDDARVGSRELVEIADEFASEMLEAMAAQAGGGVDLAEGDAPVALVELRRAWRAWMSLGAPYEAACARVQIGLACRALGDHDAVALEFDAARAEFERLDAAPDLARLERLVGAAPTSHGLTRRELQVLRLVAAGMSNRAIAEELVISERTVARHVQNILAKLGLPSRTAAGAFAFTHDLV